LYLIFFSAFELELLKRCHQRVALFVAAN